MDGSEITGGPVTHDTQVRMTINNHEEKIHLHCITIGNAPVIVGLPWLKLHNPAIDWRTHRLSFHSDECAEQYLTSNHSHRSTRHRTVVPKDTRITRRTRHGPMGNLPYSDGKNQGNREENKKNKRRNHTKGISGLPGGIHKQGSYQATSAQAARPPNPAATRYDAAIRATTPAERRENASAKRIHRHQHYSPLLKRHPDAINLKIGMKSSSPSSYPVGVPLSCREKTLWGIKPLRHDEPRVPRRVGKLGVENNEFLPATY